MFSWCLKFVIHFSIPKLIIKSLFFANTLNYGDIPNSRLLCLQEGCDCLLPWLQGREVLPRWKPEVHRGVEGQCPLGALCWLPVTRTGVVTALREQGVTEKGQILMSASIPLDTIGFL